MIIESVLVVGGLSLAFGLSLAYFAKRFAVRTDPRVAEIRKVLPGANCGACGAAGCDAFAETVVKGDLPLDACIPGQQEVAKKIADILGQKVTAVKGKNVAQLHCKGTKENCKAKFNYQGIKTCESASLIQDGYKECSYGCLGFGDCVIVCPFNAIEMQDNGLPSVNKDKCTGCGNCIKKCPKGLFKLVPADKKVHVLCSSKDIAKNTIKVCKVGCIACKQCEKACPADAIHVIDNIAKIDYSKCIICGKCVRVCPRKIILDEQKSS
ncbi:MAG: RnfABCDGE type electron transport complex subunit B [Nanoarchaeota archaeon]